MNKVKILAVAMASLACTAFAGGNLWDFATLLSKTNPDNCGNYCSQVHTPGAIFCWEAGVANGGAPPPNKETGTDKDGDPIPAWGSPCYAKTGGWWFGYADEGGRVEDGVKGTAIFKARADSCTTPKDPNPTQAIGTVVIERYIAGTGANDQNSTWSGTTYSTVAFDAAGHYFIKGYGMGDADQGLDVKFINPGGTDEKPNVSAIGFNWRGKKECGGTDWEKTFVENLKTKGNATGLCIRYKADKAGVDVELGWNEAAYECNTWINKLPATNDAWKTVNIKWETFGLSYETDEPTEPLETALTQAEALKFALKTRTATPETIRFQLKEVGWYGTCSGTAEELPPYVAGSGGGGTPIVGGKIASAYRFSINGRTLSANFVGTVQIVNLQGKVVAKKTLAANESLSLASLPAGIYMVRSTNHGIVQKVILK